MTFFNIFSNKKVKEKEKAKIIADWREKNSLVISELIGMGNAVNFEQLDIADYLVGSIAVERKTVSDMKASIIDKRIFSQLVNLKQYSEHLFILEEGDDLLSSMSDNALRGFLLSIALKFKIPIIYTKNEKETAKYLALLANKKEKDGRENSIRPNKKPISKSEQMQFILEGFPSIGPVKAKQMIEQFKTLKNIVNASEGDLEKVLGKNTKEIYNLFNQEF